MFILVFFSCVSIPTPILPIFVNITSLALWQRKHYRSASEANLVEMGQTDTNQNLYDHIKQTTFLLSYVGSYLWHSVSNDHGDITQIYFNEFKAFLNTWKGPEIFKYALHLLWWLPMLWVVSLLVPVVYWISLVIFLLFTCICLSYDCIFCTALHYIYVHFAVV